MFLVSDVINCDFPSSNTNLKQHPTILAQSNVVLKGPRCDGERKHISVISVNVSFWLILDPCCLIEDLNFLRQLFQNPTRENKALRVARGSQSRSCARTWCFTDFGARYALLLSSVSFLFWHTFATLNV